ncbi:MAG: HAD-IA family hydrolase [Gammaproteobacteria bacterium]|nr:HAD-IA family hydrolase [Gammaproteobacteria bacterium]
MESLNAIIFDCDGTLADTEETHRQAFNLAFAEFGLDWDWTPTLYAELLAISGGRERMYAYGTELRANFTNDQAYRRFIADLHKLKTTLYANLIRNGHVPLRSGVRRLIDEARAAGVTLAIATSTQASNVAALLDINLPADWRDWFTVIKSCDEVDEKKPSPAVYTAVLDALGLDPAGCVAIEDTLNGLLAADAAGLTTVITAHYYTRHCHFPQAAVVIDSMGNPAEPFRLLAGDAHGHDYLDLALIDELLGERSMLDNERIAALA